MGFERLVGIAPLGIGLTLLGFAWSQPFGGFGGISFFFRLFFSFIALAFVITGLGLLSGKATDPRKLGERLHQLRSALPPEALSQNQGTAPPTSSQAGYACPSCGAPLDHQAEVSPHGDVKCTHCQRWFNVHQS